MRLGMTPRKILIIDDSPRLIEIACALFADLPHEVLAAVGGAEGLRVAIAERPDVVLLDEEMEDMAGHEVLARMRNEAALASVPVILMTRALDDGALESAMSLGVVDCVEKPLRKDSVLARVAKALGLPERKAASFLVRMGLGSEGSFAKAVDLSGTGIRVESHEPLLVGQKVVLQFFVPGSRSRVQVAAAVARKLGAAGAGGDTTYGLRFLDLDVSVRALIEGALKGR